VAGVVALVLASRVLGSNPTPGEVERHLEKTARDLGPPGPDRYYGAGLVDATAATAQPPAAVIPSG
jgi:serine protease